MPENRTILLATLGSLGDVYPFIALALALEKNGFKTIFATSLMHRATVEQAGITFAAGPAAAGQGRKPRSDGALACRP